MEAGEPSARKQEGSSNEPLTPDLRSRQIQIELGRVLAQPSSAVGLTKLGSTPSRPRSRSILFTGGQPKHPCHMSRELVGSLCVINTSVNHELPEPLESKFAAHARVAGYIHLAMLKLCRGMNPSGNALTR